MRIYHSISPLRDFAYPTAIKVAIFCFLIQPLFVTLKAQTVHHSSCGMGTQSSLAMGLAPSVLLPGNLKNNASGKEANCLKAGRWIGALSGSTMGILQIYWSATGMSGIYGPFWKNLVTGVPSAIIGAYVGANTTEWVTRQIMKGHPKPGLAILKGAAYGAVDGAIILAVSFVPLLITGHYMGTIHFNKIGNRWVALKLIKMSIIGGALYGGTIGAGVGAIYGPCISFYMRF